MRKLEYTVEPEYDGLTVKSVLTRQLCLSDSLISRLKRRDTGIMLNGVKVYTTARVKAGDVLTAEIGDDPATPKAVPMQAALKVLWEDEDIVIIDKSAGIAVHQSTRDPQELTLENAFSAYLKEGEFFHPVSRLDRGTTGIMTVAKNGYMHQRLKQLFHTDSFRREYLGIAVGHVLPESGKIDLPIGLEEGSVYKHAIRADGAASLTEYSTILHTEEYTLLRLIPHTGRTHQLRLHMSALGFPLAGDWLYGNGEDATIQRPALHSAELWLVHPLTGEKIHLRAPLPEDMQSLIKG